MNDIKFGLKLWSTNYHLLDEARRLINEDIFHYIELMVIPDTEISPFQKIEVPYIIHIPHSSFGLNIADKEKEKFNLEIINQNIKWADELSAKYLILHPDFGEIKTAKNLLKKIEDKRILIENMPKVGINMEKMVGFAPEQIKELMGGKFGFCLDLNHAIKAAISLKKDYKNHIKDFLKLQPKVFHISDGNLNKEKDEHLNIGEGEYDFKFLLNCIKNNDSKLVTLEIPRNNLNSFEENLENLKKLNHIIEL
ncbi:TIM barrel protein [Patescibacteria group bacterium]